MSLLLAVIYLAFVSLGLPDSLLGSAWPVMQHSFLVPSSMAGYVSMTISFMTILSALAAPSLMRRFSTHSIVCFSIFLTVAGLFGFSLAPSFWLLFVFAVPYGLGAGSVDAALNHYVAEHFSSRVMNFLHCFYGLGAVISPNIMALALRYARWQEGYRLTALVQLAILLVCIFSLPLWNKNEAMDDKDEAPGKGIAEALKHPGVIPTLIAFFSYCAGEATCFLWTSSYFDGIYHELSEGIVAACGSLIFGGLMLGRLLSGIVSNRFGDRLMIRLGLLVEACGIILLFLPLQSFVLAMAGFLITGCGMGPIYPSIQHMAPEHFGREYSAAVIGLQMASAYTGSSFMPLVFGLLQQAAGIFIMPFYIAAFALLNFFFLELSYQATG